MKILLTGALGFIGRNFVLHRPKNWQVFALDKISDVGFQNKCINTCFYKVDLTSKKDVQRLAKKIDVKFDACLFLAANGDPALSVPDPLWDLQMTTETLINTAAAFNITKLIYLSSGTVYEGNTGIVTSKTTVNPTLPYATSHQAAEQYTRFFQRTGKVKEYIVIRFFGAYGPFEPPRKIYTKLVKSLGAHQQPEFTIRGDGKNLIDAMYVEDAIKAFEKIILSKEKNLTIDLCKGDHYSITRLVKTAAKTFGLSVKIKYQGSVPEYNLFYASSEEFKKTYHFSPKTSLKDGLKKLYQYYAQ